MDSREASKNKGKKRKQGKGGAHLLGEPINSLLSSLLYDF